MLAKAILLAGAAIALAGCGAMVRPPAGKVATTKAAETTATGCAGSAVEQALCEQQKDLADQRAELDRQGDALQRIEASLAKLEAGQGQVAVFSASRRQAFGSCDTPIDSASCKKMAGALCRERGFANGRVVNVSRNSSVVAIRQIACIRPKF